MHANHKLARLAGSYAQQMVRQSFFGHVDPAGRAFPERVRDVHFGARHRSWAAGENLAWGSGSLATPDAIVRAWMRSPEHRANILTRRYRETAVSVTIGLPGPGPSSLAAATYVQEFGARWGGRRR